MDKKPVLKIFRDTSEVTYGYDLIDKNGNVFLMSDGYESKEAIVAEMQKFLELLSEKEIQEVD